MKHRSDRIGEKHVNLQGCTFTIIGYKGSQNVDIRFEDSFGYVAKNKSYGAILKGYVKNPYFLSYCDFGYHGDGKYSAKKNKTFYKVWASFIQRSKNKKLKIRHPAYKDVNCCDMWANFQVFAEWMEENYNPEIMEGWQLDKDILVKGNKIYSPDTCCFVPAEINMLFNKRRESRGEYPIGVYKNLSGKFIALISLGKSNQKALGSFNTPEEAFQAYKVAKEDEIKRIADEWRDKIDPRVYETMRNYKVEITD